MNDQALVWLRERADNVPPSLAARMESAVRAAAGGSITDILSDAARICLRDAFERPDERASAYHLLAADALVTYACESAIDNGALNDGWSTEALSHMIETGGLK